MDKLLVIVLLIFLIYSIDNSDGIRCYYCYSDCFDPFNKTKTTALRLPSPSGWCMKFKASHKRESVLIRSYAPVGLCTANKCHSSHHNHIDGTACCCNTELCNNSNTSSLSSCIGLALIFGMNFIFNY